MSLQIWLPLDKDNDFKNRGAAKVVVRKYGNMTFNSSESKIGEYCAYTDGTNENNFYIEYGKGLPAANKTFAVWYKTDISNLTNQWFITATGSGTDERLYIRVCNSKFDIGFGEHNNTMSQTIVAGTGWHHYGVVVDSTGQKIDAYLDGEYVNSITSAKAFNMSNIALGKADTTGYINDFRVYDTALSAKAIKKIYQSKIVHYPLNNKSIESYTINKVNGNSLVWNQLATAYASYGSTNTLVDDNTLQLDVVNGTSHMYYITPISQCKNGHIYLQRIYVKSDGTVPLQYCNYYGQAGTYDATFTAFTNLNQSTKNTYWTPMVQRYKCTKTGGCLCQLYNTNVTGTYYIKRYSFMLFDLTMMYGAGKEPTIEQFMNDFPDERYVYDEGSFINYGAKHIKFAQLVKNGDFSDDTNNWNKGNGKFDQVIDNTLIYSLPALATYDWFIRQPMTIQMNHKYYVHYEVFGHSTKTTYLRCNPILAGNNTQSYPVVNAPLDQWYTYHQVMMSSYNNTYLGIGMCGQASNYAIGDYMKIRNIALVDLTEMFGPDREPSVTEFEQYLKDNNLTDFLYNTTKSLLPVSTKVGWQSRTESLWDGLSTPGYLNANTGIIGNVSEKNRFCTKNYIKVKPNQQVYLKAPGVIRQRFWDANFNYLGYEWQRSEAGLLTIPENAYYIKLFSYNNDAPNQSTQYFNVTTTDATNKVYNTNHKQIWFDELIKQYFPEGMKSIGSIKDSIEFTKDSIIITQKVGKYTFTGNEALAKYKYGSTWRGFRMTAPYAVAHGREVYRTDKMFGDNFNVGSAPNPTLYSQTMWLYSASAWYIVCIIGQSPAYPNWYDSTNDTLDVNILKQQLASENPTVYYALSSPIVTTIPLYKDTTCEQGILANGYGLYEGLSSPIDIETSDGVINYKLHDISGYKHNALLNGNFELSESMRYDGAINDTNQLTILNTPLKFANDFIFTVSYWVNHNAIDGTTQWIMTLADGVQSKHQIGIYHNQSQIVTQVGGYVNSQQTSWPQTITANTWYQVCLTCDGTNVSLYVNGEKKGTNTKNGTYIGNNLMLGRRPGQPTNYVLNGKLSDFRLYATCLSESDILKLYEAGQK